MQHYREIMPVAMHPCTVHVVTRTTNTEADHGRLTSDAVDSQPGQRCARHGAGGRVVPMSGRVLTTVTFGTALGAGLVAGVFFAFSSFVMAALARLPPAQAIAAMQSINVTVVNRW